MNPIVDFVKNLATEKLSKESDKLLNSNKKELSDEVKKEVDVVDEERSSFLGEVFESFLVRKFPQATRVLDLLSATWIKESDPEIYALQNEFETLTALTTFIPDRFLQKITDPLITTEWFKTIVDYYPLDSELEDKILKDKNPQAVIDFVRMLHQDVMSLFAGKNSVSA